MFIFLSLKVTSTKEFNLLIKELCHKIHHNLANRHQIGFIATVSEKKNRKNGPVRKSNPGPLAPKARIINKC